MSSKASPQNLQDMLTGLSEEQQEQLAVFLSAQAEAKVVDPKPPMTRRVSSAFRKVAATPVFGRLSQKELADSLLEFRFLHDSGCELLRTLEILSSSGNPTLAAIFTQIRSDVENGKTLADAFARHDKHVGRVVVSTIRAAEESGTLSNSLEFLADNIYQDEELRVRVKRAISYPAMTGSLTFLIFILCVMFVVPSYAVLYEKMGSEATGVSAALLGLSEFLRHFWWLWIPACVLGGVYGRRWLQSKPPSLDHVMLKLPIISRIVTLTDLSRFADRLGLLLRTGVPIIPSVKLAKETVENSVLRPLFARMATQAESGQSLADAFVDIDSVPVGVVDMIRVGEDAGALPDTLQLSASNLRKDMNRLYDRVTRWLQPIGLLIVAILVLLLVVTLFRPYLDVIESIGASDVNRGMPQ